MSWLPIAERAALPNAHITISPVPAPSRSATTTMLRVGSLSRSYGCTIKNLTPSRSDVFFVDQTVPTTFPKNIYPQITQIKPLQRLLRDRRCHAPKV